MKIAAIIAEYNPFHNGHKYQIDETRKKTGADYIVILMSGDFVQRGAPAICNKYIRTETALLGGADVVLELPSLYAISSAEYFSQGAVTLLNHLGCIDYLSFGSECGDIDTLMSCADKLCHFSDAQNKLLSELQKQGLSFPTARMQMLLSDLSISQKKDYELLLSSPNNILGLEYCKSLLVSGSRMSPVTVLRKGAGYHDDSVSDNTWEFCSASAIRSSIAMQKDDYRTHIPEDIIKIFDEHHISSHAITADDFSSLLYYKLLSEKEIGFSKYLDCNRDISDKISKKLASYHSFSDFCMSLKSKDITYSRISRILMHILLNMETPSCYEATFHERNLYTPYVRLLGFNKNASEVLSCIKKHSDIPLISNIPDAINILPPTAYSMLKKDIYCSDLYEYVSSSKTNQAPINEFKTAPIII